MVKDNHVAELGLTDAVDRCRERASFATTVEVEVERLRQSDDSALTEASGGITVGDLPAYAATGADIVSLGSLTHSADALDYSFRTE